MSLMSRSVKVTIDVLGADLDSDTSNFEATVNTETAAEGATTYTYTIDDDDDPPFAFLRI